MEIKTNVKIINEVNCLVKYKDVLKEYGHKALIVTGFSSSKLNGSLDDLIKALSLNNQEYVIFNKIMANPTVDIVFEGSGLAKENGCDFVVGLGGGSSLDSSKVIAYLMNNDIKKEDIFKVKPSGKISNIILIPTTCGTGSETTQYAILTDDEGETKTNVSCDGMFAKVAFLDYRYLESLPKHILINTTLDSVSHSIEGIFSKKCDSYSYDLAIYALGLLSDIIKRLDSPLNSDDYQKLLYSSTLAGIVISKTGTALVHSLGYSLTYYKGIDHGLANGLLLKSYLENLSSVFENKVIDILNALDIKDIIELGSIIDRYLSKPEVTVSEVNHYIDKTMSSAKYKNLSYIPSKDEILKIMNDSLNIK